ncbi:MAG: hypothetical protein IJW11_05645 [Clostridia bacterium]|nr:hypothetical protein [Clostridia bacterium]
MQAFGGESWAHFLDSINTRTDLTCEASQIDCPAPLKAIVLTGDHVDDAYAFGFGVCHTRFYVK